MATINIDNLAAPLYFGSGANRLKIATDGTPTLEGTATTWEDLVGIIDKSSIEGAAGKADYDLTERLVLMEPSGSLSTEADVVYVTYQVRHKAKASTNLKLHIHWRQPNATIQFQWKYRIINNGQASASSWSSPATVNATGADNGFTYTSGNLDQITILGDIPMSGVGISAIIQVKLARTDATPGNIYVYDLDAHYEVDSLGSSTEYTK